MLETRVNFMIRQLVLIMLGGWVRSYERCYLGEGGDQRYLVRVVRTLAYIFVFGELSKLGVSLSLHLNLGPSLPAYEPPTVRATTSKLLKLTCLMSSLS